MSAAASSTATAAGSSSGVSAAESAGIDVDAIIAKLLEVRGSRPGRQVNLAESDIRGLCTAAREIFMDQPVLLELEAPIKICGAPRARLRILALAQEMHPRRRRQVSAAPPALVH